MYCDYYYCLMQKLESRNALFLKSSLSPKSEQKNLWKKVLIKEFMSSKESTKDFDGKKRPALAVKPLHWRAPEINRFFKRLDQRSDKGKTKHS